MGQFIETTETLTESLQRDQNTKYTQENFLALCERSKPFGFRLPSQADCNPYGAKFEQLTESFLAILISIVSLKLADSNVLRAMDVMLKFLRNDPDVFAKFRPSKPLMRKMKLDVHIIENTR